MTGVTEEQYSHKSHLCVSFVCLVGFFEAVSHEPRLVLVLDS